MLCCVSSALLELRALTPASAVSAQAGVARAEGVTDPSSMSQDPIYQRLTDVYETTLSVLRQMASA